MALNYHWFEVIFSTWDQTIFKFSTDILCFRKLAGKTVYITGASRGIGEKIGLKCAKDGANVSIHFEKSLICCNMTRNSFWQDFCIFHILWLFFRLSLLQKQPSHIPNSQAPFTLQLKRVRFCIFFSLAQKIPGNRTPQFCFIVCWYYF